MAPFFDELTASFAVADARPIALAMRPESNLLKKKVNEFLISRALTGTRDVTFTDDLEGLKKRRALRMITRNNSMTYFIYRGEQMGFDYELMKRFAEGQGLRLEVVIPPTHDDLLPWLLEGRGDVVAAAMAVTPERSRRAAFTRPYNLIEEVLVVRENAKGLSRPEDLAGKKVHVRKSSSFYRTLLDLKKRVPRLRIATVAEDLETEEILAGVEKGRWDITVCDSNLLKIERSYGRKLRAAFSLREGTLAWAVHPANKKLLAALNQFIKKEYKGLHYNLLKQKYFENKKTISQTHGAFRSDVAGRISPYDVPVKKYAAQYDLDWRLITSQMYQESRFDPKRKSWVGARGLMQIMPRTARELDVDDILDPEQNIRGGDPLLIPPFAKVRSQGPPGRASPLQPGRLQHRHGARRRRPQVRRARGMVPGPLVRQRGEGYALFGKARIPQESEVRLLPGLRIRPLRERDRSPLQGLRQHCRG